MTAGYDAKSFWEERLGPNLSIATTGHAGFSERYNRYMYTLKRRALEAVLRRNAIEVAGRSVLDAGCGSGYFIDLYRSMGASDITGVDITDASVESMRKKYPSLSFQMIDIGSTAAVLGKKFDIINVFDVMYHIVDDGMFENAAANIGAWSRSGAWIFMTDALDPSRGSSGHVRYRSEETYRSVFGARGVDIMEVVPVLNFMGRGVGPGVKNVFMRRILGLAIETLAPAIYAADALYCPRERATMNLLVCRRR